MKKLIAMGILSITTALLAGCGGGGGGGGNVGCPGGTLLDPTTNTCIAPDPGLIQNNGPTNFYDYNRLFQYSGYGTRTMSGDMQITNNGAYKAFLKEAMAVCDRGSWGNYGISNCDNWTSGSFQLTVRIDSSLKPYVSFTAYPRLETFNYNFQFGFNGGGMAFNPLNLSSGNTLSIVNQNKGLEIRANGSYMNAGGLRLIQIIVREGTLADSTLKYEIFYPYKNVATQIATGILKRY